MKNLKIKLGLFSLLAVLAVSVFLTACEQETPVLEQDIVNPTNNVMLMPKGLVNQDNDKVMEYFGNLSKDDMEILREDYKVGDFLKSIDMYDQVYASLEDGLGFSEVKLDEWLTDSQLVELQTYEVSNVEQRAPVVWKPCYGGPSPYFCGNGAFFLDMQYNTGQHVYTGYFRWRCAYVGGSSSPWYVAYWGIKDRRYCNQ